MVPAVQHLPPRRGGHHGRRIDGRQDSEGAGVHLGVSRHLQRRGKLPQGLSVALSGCGLSQRREPQFQLQLVPQLHAYPVRQYRRGNRLRGVQRHSANHQRGPYSDRAHSQHSVKRHPVAERRQHLLHDHLSQQRPAVSRSGCGRVSIRDADPSACAHDRHLERLHQFRRAGRYLHGANQAVTGGRADPRRRQRNHWKCG